MRIDEWVTLLPFFLIGQVTVCSQCVHNLVLYFKSVLARTKCIGRGLPDLPVLTLLLLLLLPLLLLFCVLLLLFDHESDSSTFLHHPLHCTDTDNAPPCHTTTFKLSILTTDGGRVWERGREGRDEVSKIVLIVLVILLLFALGKNSGVSPLNTSDSLL